MSRQVKILGAGISGLTAGINLAKSGFDVTIFEKSHSVGSRFHNDFQGLENWSDEKDSLKTLKDASIETNFFAKGIKEVSIFTDLKKEFLLKDKENLFYIVERGPKKSLDESLRNQAYNSGVKIQFNSKLSGEKCQIITTGPSSKKPFAIAKGVTFDTDAEESVVLILNDRFALKGYTYFIAANGRATVATVIFDDFSKANLCFKKSLEAIEKLKKIKVNNKRYFGGYGSFNIGKSNMLNQSLCVGEAAGFQDLLMGFGMKYAFLSGYIAAKSIIEEESYDVLWKGLFLNKLKASVANRFAYELFGQAGYNYLVNQAMNSENPRAWLKNFYSYSLGRKFVYPFARLALASRFSKDSCYERISQKI
jgi:flavin-dependent dehydrogenase